MALYEKPTVALNGGEAEGIYMASGKADCWTIEAYPTNQWDGSHKVFEVKIVHSDTVQHISSASTSVITFNQTLTDAYSEGNCEATFSGNTVTVVRTLLADAYKSGDVATFKVFVEASDQATTMALAVTGCSISCTKTVNVQGGFD